MCNFCLKVRNSCLLLFLSLDEVSFLKEILKKYKTKYLSIFANYAWGAIPLPPFRTACILYPPSAWDGDVDDGADDDLVDHDDHVDYDDHNALALPVIFSSLLLVMVANSCNGIGHLLWKLPPPPLINIVYVELKRLSFDFGPQQFDLKKRKQVYPLVCRQ